MAHRILGWALVHSGDVKEGAKHYARAIEIQPDDYEARTNLASLLLAVGAKDENRHLQRALELNPYFPTAWRMQIAVLINRKEFDEARDRLREAERTLPPDRFEKLEEAVVPMFPRRVKR